MQLLQDILVVDFSQFLSGPSASLRLADLGARVIKVEKPMTGDICRELYVSDVKLEGESTIFHTINRNKESYCADLKDADDLRKIKQLISKADVVMHNFRPRVMKQLGLDYEPVKAINPAIVYAEISGYGQVGEFRELPGQDLLLQALSGLPFLNHDADHPPTPMGVAVVDILAGTHAAQGILAALYRRGISGKGALVQVSMLESALDFQFEVLACFLNDGHELPKRSAVNNAHNYVAAPYGVYRTINGYLALAMGNILQLGDLLGCPSLSAFPDPKTWFDQRDDIKRILAEHLRHQTTEHWLSILEPADIWCSEVLNYEQLLKQEGYQVLDMELVVKTISGHSIKTTRCPLRVNGQILGSAVGAPVLGQHNQKLDLEFDLNT